MEQPNLTFKRYEEKYMLNRSQFEDLKPLLEAYMDEDSHGQSTVCNIYYDTDDYGLIRRSLEKPAYKEKFRIRSYGVPDENDMIFVEIKKKFDGIVYKRRVAAPKRDAYSFVDNGVTLPNNLQIQREIEWFLNYYKPKPRMFVAYERVAYFGRDDMDFRLTFDTNIRYRISDLELSEGSDGKKIISDDEILMEVKTLGATKEWLADFMNLNHLYPISFSKYGSCYADIMTAAASN